MFLRFNESIVLNAYVYRVQYLFDKEKNQTYSTSQTQNFLNYKEIIMAKPLGYMAVAVLGAGAAVAGLKYCGDQTERTESHDPTVAESRISRFQTNLKTCLGGLVTENRIPMPVNNGFSVHIPGSDWDPGLKWQDKYNAVAVGSLDFCVPGIVNIESTTRTSSSAPADPSDTVQVTIDRSKLFVDKPHIEFEPEAQTYKVHDGHIVERDGRKLTKPEAIFAADGEYATGRSELKGQDSGFTDLVEAITIGAVDIGDDAMTNLAMVADLEAGRPKCIAAATEVVSLDTLATTSFRVALATQGYSNINVGFVPNSTWPSATKIKDEEGRTYDDRRKAVEAVLPGNQPIQSEVNCKTGRLKDTSDNVPNVQAAKSKR